MTDSNPWDEWSSNRDQESEDKEILRKFTSPNPPPAPGSDNEKLFVSALRREQFRNIENATNHTEEDLVKVLDNREVDAGDRARVALQISVRLQKQRRRRLWKFWTGWLFFLLLLTGIGSGLYYYVLTNMVSGRYSVPSTCKIPFGDGELEGHRKLSLPYKTLHGWQWTTPWATVMEEVEVVLKGDPLTIVGINEKGKPWRKEYNKGEFGVAQLPNSSTYWLIGKNFKETAVIQHADFCK